MSGEPPKGDCALPLRGVDMPMDDGREGGFATGGISPTRSTTKGTGDGEGDSRSCRIDGKVGLGESRWQGKAVEYFEWNIERQATYLVTARASLRVVQREWRPRRLEPVTLTTTCP